MEMKEIFERTVISDGERRIGYASVRYPVFDKKRIDLFYQNLAKAFLDNAERKKLCGALSCHKAYEDEEYISVVTEARLYKNTECIYRHRNSFVWNKKQEILRYIRKRGKRYSNVYYDGRELKKFD